MGAGARRSLMSVLLHYHARHLRQVCSTPQGGRTQAAVSDQIRRQMTHPHKPYTHPKRRLPQAVNPHTQRTRTNRRPRHTPYVAPSTAAHRKKLYTALMRGSMMMGTQVVSEARMVELMRLVRYCRGKVGAGEAGRRGRRESREGEQGGKTRRGKGKGGDQTTVCMVRRGAWGRVPVWQSGGVCCMADCVVRAAEGVALPEAALALVVTGA